MRPFKFLLKGEKFVIDSIENKPSSFFTKVLYLLSGIFKCIALLRCYIYDKGWREVRKGDLPIVCIGNITAGGTGKTPLVERLAEDLSKEIKLAIISKGYRSLGVSRKDVISPIDRCHREVDSIYCGDEPFILKKHLPEVEVFLSKDRELAIRAAKKRHAEIALLDDGFQMRSLAKDLVVLVLHAKDLFGLGYYLPRGYLRESPKRLKEAHLLCITQNYFDSVPFEDLCEKIKPYAPSSKIIGAHIVPKSIKGDMDIDLQALRGKKVGFFCGIGRPKSFLETLQSLGVDIVETLLMPDHRIPNEEDLKLFSRVCAAKGAEILLCTEKDFVKIVHTYYHLLPVCYLETKLNIVYGKNYYEEFKAQIINLAKKG